MIIERYVSGESIPQISDATGIPRSTIRFRLKKAGVLRSRAEGVRIAAKQGRLQSMKGVKRVFTEEHKAAIREASRKRASKNAVGVSAKKSGYVEFTNGPHKGKALHRVTAESVIGRKLERHEHVHHIDGDRSNNDPSNLQVLSIREHARLHATERDPTRNRDHKGRYTNG